ncbi:MAG TPA: hypothetical protein VFD46_14975 [Chryseolinea sp.]|nr:hypothetical protein [Chryseolinea sp.]
MLQSKICALVKNLSAKTTEELHAEEMQEEFINLCGSQRELTLGGSQRLKYL